MGIVKLDFPLAFLQTTPHSQLFLKMLDPFWLVLNGGPKDTKHVGAPLFREDFTKKRWSTIGDYHFI